MHRMRKYVGLAALAMMATASPALAQVCAGFPMATGSTNLLAGVTFPDNANGYSVGVLHKPADAVVVGASYTLTTFDEILNIEIPSAHNFAVEGSYEIPLAAESSAADVALCPNVGFGYGSWDEITTLTAPLGLALGAAFKVADGSTIVAPFANPFFMWQRASANDVSDSETDFGFAAGSNILISNFLVGFTFSKIGDADGTFGFRIGMFF